MALPQPGTRECRDMQRSRVSRYCLSLSAGTSWIGDKCRAVVKQRMCTMSCSSADVVRTQRLLLHSQRLFPHSASKPSTVFGSLLVTIKSVLAGFMLVFVLVLPR
jgi:hypothetical protein